MRTASLLLALLLIVVLCPIRSLSQTTGGLPALEFEEYKLKNGLHVILYQDRSTTTVAVNVWYHVGSKDEKPGKTGFAHLFEHLMFLGSKNYNANFYIPLEEAGANLINGVTTSDTTNYFEVLPSNYLELALYLEADRMGNLLETLTQDRLDNARDVVKNELRQSFYNVPYGTWRHKVYAELYPKDHPYNWHTAGSIDDLAQASLEDARAFFRRYYVPNNALLSVAGNFDAKQAKIWIEKYFGPIEKGQTVVRPDPAQPKLNGVVRRMVEDAVPEPRIYLVWHGVGKYAADEAALQVLVGILSRGRSSRFAKLFGQGIVQNISAFHEEKELAGMFVVQATPTSGKTLDDVENEITLEINRIKKEPPSDKEIARVVNQIEYQKLSDLQRPVETGDLLADFAVFLNKTDYFRANVERYRSVTPADIQRVAKTYLGNDRLVMSFVPRKEPPAASVTPASTPEPKTQNENKKTDNDARRAQQSNLPKPGPDPKISMPPVEKLKLKNGLETWLVPYGNLPIVTLLMVQRKGVASEPEGKYGVHALTSSLLRSGTTTRSAVEISEQIQLMGATMTGWIQWDYEIHRLHALSKSLDQALQIQADMFLNPTFPESELELSRRNTINSLTQQAANQRSIANWTLSRTLYGHHPYGRGLWGDVESLQKISREDVVNYYRSTFLPNNFVLILVGSFDKKTVIPKLEKAFGDWKPGPIPTTTVAKLPPPKDTTIYLIDKPGATQSSIRIGHLTAGRNNPDYVSMEVLNSILGWSTNSRINMNIRSEKGYAYSVGTFFGYNAAAGRFECFAEVQTAVTKDALSEILKELEGIRGAHPASSHEVESHSKAAGRRFSAGMGNVEGIAGVLAEQVGYGLPDSYLEDYIAKADKVTQADVTRVATRYLDPDKLVIVVVGDRKTIEPGLKELRYPVIHLDANGLRQNDEVKAK